MVKAFKKLGIKGPYFNIIKAIHCKPIANITKHGGKLKSFPLKSGMQHRCLLSLLLFNIVLEIFAKTIRLEREKG
jgi:hypothetical protein